MKHIKFYFTLFFFAVLNIAGAQWTKIKNYPGGPTDGCISFSINGKGYVGGGGASNKLYEFNPATNTWTVKANIPNASARAWASAFVLNNKAYVLCGDTAFGGLHDDMWMFDPTTNTWTKKADFPGGLRDGQLCFVNGNAAFVGGGFDGTFILSEFYKYYPMTDTWTKLNDLPYTMLFPQTFTLYGNTFVTQWQIGGGNYSNKLLVYNVTTDSWIEKAACPGTGRDAGVSFAAIGKGYVGLGEINFSTGFTDMYEYNSFSNTWKTLDSFPVNAGWATAFVINDTAYIGSGANLPSFSYTNVFYKRYFGYASGIQETGKENHLYVYPNPSHGTLSIESENEGVYSIVNAFGQTEQTFELNAKNGYLFNIENVSPGVYFVVGINRNQITNQKIVVIR